MKQNFLRFFLGLLFFSVIGLQGCSESHDPLIDDNEEGVFKVLHGVCRSNLKWVSNNKAVEIANGMVNSDIPVVRTGGGDEIDQIIHRINIFSQRGIKLVLIVGMRMEMFPEGYEKVPGPNFEVFRMSDIDLDRFYDFVNELLEQIAIHTSPEAVIAVELFNEANWGDFNGDLQPTPEGKGEVFTLDTPLDYPPFQSIYTGIGKYGKCIEMTKNLMNLHFIDRDVKLVTTGLFSGGLRNNYSWSISNGITVIATDMFMNLLQGKHPGQTDKTNYLQFADGIGIHAYPALVDDMAKELRSYYFDPINAVLDKPMPYWMTEWGFARPQFQNNGGEKRRLQYMRSFIQAIETIGGTAMTALYEFDATTNHNIWENGTLLESGTIFQEINK